MQNVYYINNDFIKEHSLRYYLSIRYATDGLSFCIHDSKNDRLLILFHQPFYVENNEVALEKAKQILEENAYLNLRFQKVFLLTCQKEKLLIPKDFFKEELLIQFYQTCFPLHKNEMFLPQEIKALESYIIETLPINFVTFLKQQYPTISIVSNAFSFIKQSLTNLGNSKYHLFLDLHHLYFDLLLTRGTEILLFNSFHHQSISDIAYYAINCLQQHEIHPHDLKTICSGNLVNEPTFSEILEKYLPHLSIQNDSFLREIIPNKDLNYSNFIHLLNIHQCEL